MPAPRRSIPTAQRKQTEQNMDIQLPSSVTEKKKTETPNTGGVLALAVIVSLIVGGISGAVFSQTDIFSSIADTLTNNGAQHSAQQVDTQSLRVEEESQTIDVVSDASESVVSIIITKDLSEFYNSTGPNTFPFYEFFNPNGVPDGGTQEIGGGTGFIIGEDGLIVTNKHVVSDTEAEYTVLLNNRESYPAKVIATDPLNDIAFVKIETSESLPTLTLGDSDALKNGQTVIAIGNALGEYRNTVTRGIVSGLSRTVVAGDGAGSQETLDNVIQTDAAINPGNSGGPLLNLAGQVIGVNTAISREGQLIGFAIPINQVKQAIESVQQEGRVIRPMLGVRYVSINEEIATQNDLPVSYGALIVSGSTRNEPAIVPDSAADKAGLQEDDILLEINGEKIDGDTTLSRIIQKYEAGDQVTLKYLRDGKETETSVIFDELPTS